MPLPPPIRVAEFGSFAYHTITERLPDLCHRVIAENDFSQAIEANLRALAAEMPEGKIIPIADHAIDVAAWHTYLQPYLNRCWLDLPWYFSEAYFYRRVLVAIDYFQTGIDPYRLQKRLGLDHAIDAIQALSQQCDRIQGTWDRANFVALLYTALWGNRVDLSLFPAQPGRHYAIQTIHDQDNLLVDQAEQISDWIAATSGRLDFIIDNAGFELSCDLCLADYLLTSQRVEQIRFHTKSHPIFVSDAMPKDVVGTIAHLEALQPNIEPSLQSLLCRLKAHIAGNRLQIQHHSFWTSPLLFEEMPADLREELGQATLVLVKGDANYRRLLGDRHWDFTTPFEQIVSYFPTAVAALRTLKSEIACGLTPDQIDRLTATDPDWLINGKRGVIQLLRS
ncbi:MAG TPA: damage-control phosphatase ARMT1 family protein [Allocoleopsis sp.]